jgi:hypothetical protein
MADSNQSDDGSPEPASSNGSKDDDEYRRAALAPRRPGALSPGCVAALAVIGALVILTLGLCSAFIR